MMTNREWPFKDGFKIFKYLRNIPSKLAIVNEYISKTVGKAATYSFSTRKLFVYLCLI